MVIIVPLVVYLGIIYLTYYLIEGIRFIEGYL